MGGDLLSMQQGLSCSCIFLRPRQVSLILIFSQQDNPITSLLGETNLPMITVYHKEESKARLGEQPILHTPCCDHCCLLLAPVAGGLPSAERQTPNEGRKLWVTAVQSECQGSWDFPGSSLSHPSHSLDCRILCHSPITNIKPWKAGEFPKCPGPVCG